MIQSFTEPLEYIPVRHVCGHYELRLTRWSTHRIGTGNVPSNYDPEPIGYLEAGNSCTACNAQGRPLEPCYPSLEVAKRMKPILDASRSKGIT